MKELPMIDHLHHVGIVVDDLDRAAWFLTEVLGLELERSFEVPELKRSVAFYRCGPALIELVAELDPEAKKRTLDGAVAKIEHVALGVLDIHDVAARLAALGVSINEHGIVRTGDRLNAWTDPATTFGIMFQLTAPMPNDERRPLDDGNS
jgi:catechol 2,3-dioxygenase-like lactoylglutathione lyase family enzyme